MFGLSLSKLLFTIFVVVVVWKGFGLVSRLARERAAEGVGKPNQPRRTHTTSSRTVELVQCDHCGAYYDPREGCHCGHARG